MQTAINRSSFQSAKKVKKPSLFIQIVQKVERMDEGDQKLLLLTISKNELTDRYKKLDEEIEKSGEVVAGDKIDRIVAGTRKKMYEQKIRS